MLYSFKNKVEGDYNGPFEHISISSEISKYSPYTGFYGLGPNVAIVRNIQKKIGAFITPSRAFTKDWKVTRFAVNQNQTFIAIGSQNINNQN
jgi:hypothetical protein